ncbi:MAG: 23S rRNA (guanosine(2251)-2'-O)-methyltransferase RlmB [Thermoleophilia bacterium]
MEWIYGRNVIRVALGAGARRRARKLAATAPALKALEDELARDVPVEIVTAQRLDELTGSREHQGVALQVDDYAYASGAALLQADLIVVLDEVTDPHNLGAVARSAAAAGAGGVVVPKHRSASVTPAAVKASAGMTEHIAVAQVTNIVAYIKELQAAGFWVYGAAGGAGQTLWNTDLRGRVALVCGAEGRGLRPLVARTCDALVAIPMASPVESLNVSVAAALLLFEARRQRVSSEAVRPL